MIFDKIEIKKNDLVIDCGANIGDITSYFADRGAKIFSFEPNIYAFNVLLSRFKNNPNVVCIQKGVSSPEQAGSARLFLHEKCKEDQIKYSTGSSIMYEKNNINKENFLDIQLVDLCKFIKNIRQQIKVLKIDIEGAEISLLDSLIKENIYQQIDYIFVETHEKKIPSLAFPLEEIKKTIKNKNIHNINLNWI